MNVDPIVKQLWMARIKAGLSMRAVSRRAGHVSPTLLSECERGYHAPSLGNLRKWATALGFELILREVGPGSTSPEPGRVSVTPAIPAVGPDDQLFVLTNALCGCAAHGPHPHNGMRCLDCPECMETRLAEVKRIAALRTAAESTSPEPGPPTRRLRACVEAWPEAETMGYDPRCCRFPKSCSATVYDEHLVDDADLEPAEPTKGGTE